MLDFLLRCIRLVPLGCLIACAEGGPLPSAYLNSSNIVRANIDDHAISVVPDGIRQYVAWGGENNRDGFVQYRQRRAIELVSQCRIARVSTVKTADWTRATVTC